MLNELIDRQQQDISLEIIELLGSNQTYIENHAEFSAVLSTIDKSYSWKSYSDCSRAIKRLTNISKNISKILSIISTNHISIITLTIQIIIYFLYKTKVLRIHFSL